jgi:hypothetical protein
MLRIVTVAVFSFWTLVASAYNWQIVAETKLGQLKLDRTSVASAGKYTSAELIYEFRELQRLTSPPKAVFNKRLDDVLVDCINPLFGLQTSRFFEDQKIVYTYQLNLADIKFNPPLPDTMAATVFDSVCAIASKVKH